MFSELFSLIMSIILFSCTCNLIFAALNSSTLIEKHENKLLFGTIVSLIVSLIQIILCYFELKKNLYIFMFFS
jgi:divalent metal cation (Fe/Co/Zn/Cd) transporter